MLPIDSLVTIGLATVSLGTINEADGRQEHGFWLRNAGTEAVSIVQGYTSCGCVTLAFPLGETVQPGDSVMTVLGFDPKGKGGEFHERGTIVYGQHRKRLDLAMEGVCVTSEETLMLQFPVKINDDIRLSSSGFDLGMMAAGEVKTRNFAILHRDENDRREYVTVEVDIDKSLPEGVHRIEKQIKTIHRGEEMDISVCFDVRVE